MGRLWTLKVRGNLMGIGRENGKKRMLRDIQVK
jgi:hypothetical protein